MRVGGGGGSITGERRGVRRGGHIRAPLQGRLEEYPACTPSIFHRAGRREAGGGGGGCCVRSLAGWVGNLLVRKATCDLLLFWWCLWCVLMSCSGGALFALPLLLALSCFCFVFSFVFCVLSACVSRRACW